MGIQGLLPQLKSIMAPIGVEELRGQTVAVDTYSWLHKGALSCGDRLCKGIPTTRHIEYCMHRVNLLRHHGVKPILVFDGGLLPMKSDQETKRARSRKENLERAQGHEAAGNSRAAFECYQKAVDITPRIALELIKMLKRENVDYIVAPYEADAQMTFLSVNKLVDAVITEDSDLIPFGCSRIIFKMDKFGQGVEFQITRLERNKELDFNGFTKQMLLEMCILSGCDYLPSLPGMGVKRAHALFQKLKSYEKVIKHLRYSAASVPPQYEENFKKAICAFQYQRVYDPATEDIVHLSGIPHDLNEDLEFLGPWLPQTVVKGIAVGEIDPITKESFEVKTECSVPASDKVYRIRESIIPSNGKKRLDLPVQKNILTNYFCLASLEAKRKFRAPKVTPKQHILNASPLSSPQIKDSGTPDSTEDTSLPATCTLTSQCSSEYFSSVPPQDDSTNAASQCSSEHFSFELRRDDSASVLPHNISQDIHSEPPYEDKGIEDPKVEVSYFKRSTSPADSCLERKLHQGAEQFSVSHNMEPSRPVPHCTESNVAPNNRKITVRSSYFKKGNKNVYTNQGEDELDDEDNCETGNCTLSGDKLKKPGGALKRRKLCDLQNFEDEALQSTASHDSPPAVDEDCHTDTLDGVNTNTEARFGCNISHVNTYNGIAEKSMDKFAALISSFRYGGSRASGLRAPLKDVKNTLSVRSVLRPPEQKFSSTAKKAATSQSRFTSDATNTADGPPDLSTFAYRPMKSAAVLPDQGKITNKSAGAPKICTDSHLDQSKSTWKATSIDDSPPDLSTFAYKRMPATVSHSDRSKFSSTVMRTANSPPDLSTFAYNPMKSASRRSDGSRFAGSTLKAAGRISQGKFP